MSEIQPSLRVPISEERIHQDGGFVNRVAITVGVTGTRYREKITPGQTRRLGVLLRKVYDLYYLDGEVWLAHGDCVGWDEVCHDVAKEIGYKIRIFPPSNDVHRANCNGNFYEVPQLYSIRNHDIVRASDYIIGGPKSDAEQVRSGTWATIRYARKQKKPYTIIYPNGRMEGRNWELILKPAALS